MTTSKTSEKIDQYFEKREIISRLKQLKVTSLLTWKNVYPLWWKNEFLLSQLTISWKKSNFKLATSRNYFLILIETLNDR